MEGYSKFMTLATVAAVLGFAATAMLTVQPAKALSVPHCSLCAKDFAPGQEATSPGPSCHGCASQNLI